MGKITNKRSRTPNWSPDEKHYLLELIKTHKDVITKPNNGPNQHEEKDAAWNDILRKLTEKFGNKFADFSLKKLKTQWQNMKRIAREEITNYGDQLQKYTKVSLDVCDVLQLDKNGAIKTENVNATIATDIEIKTECIDEEMNDASIYENTTIDNLENTNTYGSTATTLVVESDTSCVSERNDNETSKRSVDTMTDFNTDNLEKIAAFRENLEEMLRCADSEKQLKLESLQEQRQIMKAMRETAELNKIIAEQKLKHVLWLKKHDIT
ncbi:uncharacterized protein LOC121730667 [Aricia agestis]|uniref:uncharacterized protein LOC121730667 n=1 Tax=Aricia agestis TaxID=91739 RepID=UPI001C202AF0|nr:uncharacterized protein LOC121730667 [Aricia agestis]